jgi:hypothetical protein
MPEARRPRSVLTTGGNGNKLGLSRKSINPAFRVMNGGDPRSFAAWSLGPKSSKFNFDAGNLTGLPKAVRST